jgi:hypothetical protein
MTFANASPTETTFSGVTLIPNGEAIFCPTNGQIGVYDGHTPAAIEFCRSPYFNKF